MVWAEPNCTARIYGLVNAAHGKYPDRLLAWRFGAQGPQPFGDGVPGFRQLHPVLVEALHHGQDEIGLGFAEFTYIQGHHLAAPVGENREGKCR